MAFSRALIAAGILLVAARASAAEHATFVFEFDGVPVGTVSLEYDKASGTYRYTSLHLYRREGERAQRVRTEHFRVDAEGRDVKTGRYPESLALWRGPRGAPCVAVQEELWGGQGELCTTHVDGGALRGTLRGQRWEAQVRKGRLVSLSIGAARFMQVRSPKLASPPDLLRRSWSIAAGEGALVVSGAEGKPRQVVTPRVQRPFPSPAKARALSRRVRAALQADTSAACLEHARRFVHSAREQGLDALVVHGLVASEDGRSVSPHAWVRVAIPGGWYDVDPTLEEEVTPQTHVALGIQRAAAKGETGRLWLELFAGELQVSRAAR